MIWNIDGQDAQDLQDVTPVRTTLTWAMIRRRLADSQEHKTPEPQKQILYILFTHEPFVILGSVTPNGNGHKRHKNTICAFCG